MIHYQPRPKIPPIGFFEPISVDPKDMMTDVEFLLGILKKLNEVIKQVNEDHALISQISEIAAELTAMQEELARFEAAVDEDITNRFNAIVIELNAKIATFLTEANAYTDTKFAYLEQEIEQIVVGQITVYDPTTGTQSPLQTVLDNIYNSGRSEALTATEYDELELTATEYDAEELTALQYDQSGKTLLVTE